MGANNTTLQSACSICAHRKEVHDATGGILSNGTAPPVTSLPATARAPPGSTTISPFTKGGKPPPNVEEIELHQVLASETLTAAFIEFARSEYAEKNLLFALAVQDYKHLITLGLQDGARVRAADICAQYIDVGAEYEVTIGPSQRALVQDRLKATVLSADAFAPALQESDRSLAGDQFPRFRASPLLAKAVWRDHFQSTHAQSQSGGRAFR
jgi:hypothetical protein